MTQTATDIGKSPRLTHSQLGAESSNRCRPYTLFVHSAACLPRHVVSIKTTGHMLNICTQTIRKMRPIVPSPYCIRAADEMRYYPFRRACASSRVDELPLVFSRSLLLSREMHCCTTVKSACHPPSVTEQLRKTGNSTFMCALDHTSMSILASE